MCIPVRSSISAVCVVLFLFIYLLYASGKDAVILGYFGVLLFGLVLDGRIGLGRIAWIGWVW